MKQRLDEFNDRTEGELFILIKFDSYKWYSNFNQKVKPTLLTEIFFNNYYDIYYFIYQKKIMKYEIIYFT